MVCWLVPMPMRMPVTVAIASVGSRGPTSHLNGISFLKKRAYLLESICSSLICINAQIGIRYYRLFLSAKFDSNADSCSMAVTAARNIWDNLNHFASAIHLLPLFIIVIIRRCCLCFFPLYFSLHNRFASPRCFPTTIMIFSKDWVSCQYVCVFTDEW